MVEDITVTKEFQGERQLLLLFDPSTQPVKHPRFWAVSLCAGSREEDHSPTYHDSGTGYALGREFG